MIFSFRIRTTSTLPSSPVRLWQSNGTRLQQTHITYYKISVILLFPLLPHLPSLLPPLTNNGSEHEKSYLYSNIDKTSYFKCIFFMSVPVTFHFLVKSTILCSTSIQKSIGRHSAHTSMRAKLFKTNRIALYATAAHDSIQPLRKVRFLLTSSMLTLG